MLLRTKIAVVLAIVGLSVSSGIASSAEESPFESANEAHIQAAVADIEDLEQRAFVEDWMREVSEGAEILGAETADFELASGSTARAYPSGCGLSVLVIKRTNAIDNSSLTSCLSSYQFLTHTMDITGIDGFSGNLKPLAYQVYNYMGSNSQAQTLRWTCKNKNASNFRVKTQGIMAKNSQEYSTPWVYDLFDAKVACGW